MASELRWSIPVGIDDLPPDGRDYAFAAGESERVAIAQALGLVAVPRLDVRFHVRRIAADGLHVTGTVSATVTQNCVVTLDPVENEVDEAVDVSFSPSADTEPDDADADIETDPEAPDPPDALVNGRIDLAAIAVEFLQLGLDPYPRKPGVEFEPPAEGDQAESPFSVLASLKRPAQ